MNFVQLSLTPIVIGVLAAILCALPGNFLALRRQALLSDAISHAVLPGIVVAFLFSGEISPLFMMIGAGMAALLASLLIALIRRFGHVEPGAAMGIIFTAMFAFGVLLLEQSDTSRVHLDVEHALYGNLESLIWLGAEDWGSLTDPRALGQLPRQLSLLAVALVLVAVFIGIFWKELLISTFDDLYARTVGIRSAAMEVALVMITAVAAVAAFSAVGSILVVAMFICPPGAARLLTRSLGGQLWASVAFAAFSAAFGYILAGYGPGWFGLDISVSAAGSIAVVSGIILALARFFGHD